jgi:SAM-dependent methyltransferase
MPSLATWLRTFGLDPKRACAALRGIHRYRRERRRFRETPNIEFAWGRELPILDEWSESSGSLGAYFHQDLRVAGWIHQENPRRHVDVGSRIDGFIGHLAVFREVEVLDIRPQPHAIPNIFFHQLDLMAELPETWIECTDSLSCLHTIEHFGLGRYGDTIDPMGHEKGLAQLKRMVKPGGVLYLATPIGPQRVEFNAHRIFAAKTLVGWFDDGWVIERFAHLDDSEVMHENPNWREADLENNFGCQTGLGIVAARKNSTP